VLIFDHWVLNLEIRREALFFLITLLFAALVNFDSSFLSKTSASSRLFFARTVLVFFVSVRSSDITALLRRFFFLSCRKLFIAAFLFGIVCVLLK